MLRSVAPVMAIDNMGWAPAPRWCSSPAMPRSRGAQAPRGVLLGHRRRPHRPGAAVHPAADRPSRPQELPQDPRPAVRPEAGRCPRGPHPHRSSTSSSTAVLDDGRVQLPHRRRRAAPHHRVPRAAGPAGLAAARSSSSSRTASSARPPDPRGAQRMVDASRGEDLRHPRRGRSTERQREPQDDFMLRLPHRRGRRPSPHPRRDPRHLVPLLPRRARHRHRVARLLPLLPGPATPSSARPSSTTPPLIPSAIEEMLRWETPVTGIVRITTAGHRARRAAPSRRAPPSSVLLGSANTDPAGSWPTADTVDFDGRSTSTSRSAAAPTAASARTSPGWS